MKVLAKLKDNDNKTLTRVFKGIRAAFGPLPWTNSQIMESLRGRMNSAGEKGKASQHEGYVGPERGGHVGGKGKKLGGRVGAAFVDKKVVVVVRDYRPHFVMYDGGRNVDLEEDVRGPLVADPPPAGDRPLDVEEALEDAQGGNLTVIFLGGPKPAFDPAPYIDIGQVAAEVGLDLWDWVAPDEPMAVDPFLELGGGVGFPPLEEEDVQFLEGFGQGAEDPVGANPAPNLGSPDGTPEEKVEVASPGSGLRVAFEDPGDIPLSAAVVAHMVTPLTGRSFEGFAVGDLYTLIRVYRSLRQEVMAQPLTRLTNDGE